MRLPRGKQEWQDALSGVPVFTWVVFILLLLLGVFTVWGATKIVEDADALTESRNLLPEERDILDGLYYMTSEAQRDTKSVVSVEGDGAGNYIVTVYSEFLPLETTGRLLPDNTFEVDGFGVGRIEYKPSFNLVKITFDTQNYGICTFSK